jgi:hypothetical protein
MVDVTYTLMIVNRLWNGHMVNNKVEVRTGW